MRLSADDLGRLPRKDEDFTHDSSNPKFNPIDSIGYEYSIYSPTLQLDITNTISATEASATDVIFSFEQEFEVSDLDGNPVVGITNDYVYSKACQAILSASTSTVASPAGQQVKLTTTTANTGAAPQKVENTVSAQAARNTSLMNRLKTIASYKKHGFRAGAVVPIVVGAQVINLQINDLPSKRHLNALSGKIEGLKGIKAVGYENNVLIESIAHYESNDGSYTLTDTTSTGLSSYQEDIGKKQWLQTSIDKADADSLAPLLIGFSDQDFQQSNLTYVLQPQTNFHFFENAGQYFSIRSLPLSKKKHSFVVHSFEQPTPATILPWNSPTSRNDQPYLARTLYIHPDAVKQIADQLRVRLTGLNRLQAAVVIIQEVSSLISFDDQSVDTDIVNTLSTEDILKNKKGVCQHYAALFVAIARELGVPTRLTQGYYLQASGPGAHAWVEVKLNNQTWWPLEPQEVSSSLPSRRYFPLGRLWSYEVPADRPDLETIYNLKDQASFAVANKMNFKRMSVQP